MKIIKELAIITLSGLLLFGFFIICLSNSPANNEALMLERQ